MADKEQKRIFIGGLVKGVTETELVEKFSRFGEVGQIEIKTRNSDLDSKTFAYLNLTAAESGFKKCFTAYNNTKWKGGQLKLQFAKESFLSKLKQEQEDAVRSAAEKETTPAAVHKSPALEAQGKKAVPGTPLDDEGKWVMGKYSRALPVLRVKKPSSKKVVTLDPSKTLHSLKKLKSDDNMESSAKTSDLTWQMDEKDNDITKRRKGEFPVWKPLKKESVFSRLHSLAAEEYVSDTEMEVVPLGKTAPKAKPVVSSSADYDSSDSAGSADTDEIITKASGKKSSQGQPAKRMLKGAPHMDANSNNSDSLTSAGSDDLEETGTKPLQKKKLKVKPSKPTPKNVDKNRKVNDDSDSAGSTDTDEIISRASRKSVVTKPANTSAEVAGSKIVSAKVPNGKNCGSTHSDSSVSSRDQPQALVTRTLSKKKGGKAGDTTNGLLKVSDVRRQRVQNTESGSSDSDEAQSRTRTVGTRFQQKPASHHSSSDSDSSGDESSKVSDTPKSGKREKPLIPGTRKRTASSSSESDSDNSDTETRPQFQFVKTTTTQSKCLRKSAKLTPTRTPAFKGLGMLSGKDEVEVRESVQVITSFEKKAAENVRETVAAEEKASKSPKKKAVKEVSPHGRDVAGNVKPERKVVDGSEFIQRSHQARQKNLEEVKKQENLITKSIREGTGSKHVKFSDSEEDSSTKKEQPVEPEKKAALALFEDSASEEDEGEKESTHDFSIRPQFEGKKGQKLMELQNKIKDSRFRMDDRFAESDSEQEEEEEPIKDPDEIEMAEEKARNLKILEEILGYKPRQRRENIYQGVKRYLDPVKSKHLEITPETAVASKQPKKGKLDSEAQSDISDKKATDNKKYDSSNDSEDEEDAKSSEDEDSGDDGDDEEEKATDESSKEDEDEEEKDKSKESSQDEEDEEKEEKSPEQPVIHRKETDDGEESAEGGNNSNLGDLFAGGSSFTFFGTAVKESSDEEEAATERTEPLKAVSQSLKDAVTVRVEDDEEDMEEQEEVPSKEQRPAVKESMSDRQQPSFMIAQDDPRLQAAVRFFKRPPEEEFEELVAEWPDQRQKIMQIVRERHKRALRKERQTQRQEQWKRKHTWKKSRK